MMETVYEKYQNDPRVPCRYGEKCYQRNSDHLNKYKHPPKKNKRKQVSKVEPSKRFKLNETTHPEKTENLNNVTNEKDVTKRECISPSGSESDSITENNPTDDSEKCTEVSNSPEGSVNDRENEDEEKNLENIVEKLPHEEKAQKKNQPFDPKLFIKSRFLVSLPSDFYDFWEFCKDLHSADPTDALKDVGLKLVGPFDVLAGKFKHVKKTQDEYLIHWRYYYDPPEVLTILKGDNNTGYHIGYFYDSPDEDPSLLVSNYGTKDGVFTKLGDNIFAAVNFYLEELKKIGDPFKKMHIGKITVSIKARADKLKLNLSLHSDKIKKREKQVVAKTFNKIGLVVPYNKKTQLGYRDLAIQDKELMNLLNKLETASPEQKPKYLSDLQPILTYANIALDECDFGTGIKLGWELLYHGIDNLNSTITQFLSNSYRLLNKEAFAQIIEAHMKNRKKGSDLSII